MSAGRLVCTRGEEHGTQPLTGYWIRAHDVRAAASKAALFGRRAVNGILPAIRFDLGADCVSAVRVEAASLIADLPGMCEFVYELPL